MGGNKQWILRGNQIIKDSRWQHVMCNESMCGTNKNTHAKWKQSIKTTELEKYRATEEQIMSHMPVHILSGLAILRI